MEKIFILGAGFVLTLSVILAVILLAPTLSGSPISSSEKAYNQHAWTKAICTKDKLCQDYVIECQGESVSKLSPITGSVIQFDSSWQDPRTLEQRERLCA